MQLQRFGWRGGVVTATQIEGVEPEPIGKIVERRLEGERSLREAGGAERHRRPGVGEDVLLLDLDVGTGVDHPGRAADAGATGDPARAVRFEVDRGEVAVALGADPDPLHRIGPVAGPEILRAPVEHQLDRGLRPLRQHGGDHARGAGAELGPESAAEKIGHDPDVIGRDFEELGQIVAESEHALGGGPDAQLPVLPARHGAVRLERVVQRHRGPVGPLDGRVGLPEAGLDVAALADARGRGVLVIGEDLRGAWLARLVRVDDVRQDLVARLDQADGVLGDLGGDRRDRGDLLACVQHAAQPSGSALLLAGLVDRAPGILGLPKGREAVRPVEDEHGLDAREARRARGIDGNDARMSVRAAQDRAMKHAAQLDVVGVGGPAGHLGRAVDAGDRLADDVQTGVRVPDRRLGLGDGNLDLLEVVPEPDPDRPGPRHRSPPLGDCPGPPPGSRPSG